MSFFKRTIQTNKLKYRTIKTQKCLLIRYEPVVRPSSTNIQNLHMRIGPEYENALWQPWAAIIAERAIIDTLDMFFSIRPLHSQD
jgi:hypothetical protein